MGTSVHFYCPSCKHKTIGTISNPADSCARCGRRNPDLDAGVPGTGVEKFVAGNSRWCPRCGVSLMFMIEEAKGGPYTCPHCGYHGHKLAVAGGVEEKGQRPDLELRKLVIQEGEEFRPVNHWLVPEEVLVRAVDIIKNRPLERQMDRAEILAHASILTEKDVQRAGRYRKALERLAKERKELRAQLEEVKKELAEWEGEG